MDANEDEKSDNNSYEDMEEETRRMLLESKLKVDKEKRAAAKKVRDFREDIDNKQLETFEDRPDEIKLIFVCSSNQNSVVVSWDSPDDNNSPIESFNIYISDQEIKIKIENIGDNVVSKDEQMQKAHEMKLVENIKNNKTNSYVLKELKANSVYYVMVTALNKFGEGYRPKEPSLVITQD